MARPKSDDKRNAIMDAATRVIVTQGLSAPTATIAREAGISNGSLFTYFETKADLFNQLYLELKSGMAAVILEKFPAKADLRKQAFHVWSNWTQWASTSPDKRRALTQLNVSDLITPETRAAAQKAMGGLADMVEQMRAGGSMRNAPMSFVGALMTSIAETTMDFMVSDPARAKQHCKTGFEAFWRAMS
ncbi:TetR/AcrR family transcriptional regulator [Roseimicrobium sp. ORNL1]|uniref:TetR/AcrR family transcriptional regulator n=1 Tax=Roseimicrobium sp. ORNL1 TaxID=2711231 RepID=UPI0013E1D5D0|nr:TetR/AcrR family transcriptional regulator [Roseimicrobium sp. ORNL1]QIF00975.1 TetR/AcrR family transcriptional regulator [Roseimicrobium sp. ORNL1]